MFMRLVQVRVRPDRIADMTAAYERQIIPTLEQVDGCRFASLVQSTVEPDECISLTLWDSEKAAEEYVHNGTFDRLLEGVRSLLATTTEWKVHLSADKKLEYVSVSEEPTVKGFFVSPIPQADLPAENPGPLYVRILSLRFKPDKMDEFKEIYRQKILPVLHRTEGCRYAYLTENANDKDEAISMTIWDSKDDADEYERNGTFDFLLREVKHLLSGLYQWKMSLGKAAGKTAVTSEDMSVEGYQVVTGRSFL